MRHGEVASFLNLFGDLEHMSKVSYLRKWIVICILDVGMHIGVLALPCLEYNSSILRDVVHTLEAKFVKYVADMISSFKHIECMVDIISSFDHDGSFSLRWI